MTREEKEQYFAQYWGQKVGRFPFIPELVVVNSGKAIRQLLNIELTSIEYVSDEHAIELGIITGHDKGKFTKAQLLILGSGLVEDYLTYGYFEELNEIKAIDFLRSKGYAVAFRSYSVDDLVKEGVLKLREI